VGPARFRTAITHPILTVSPRPVGDPATSRSTLVDWSHPDEARWWAIVAGSGRGVLVSGWGPVVCMSLTTSPQRMINPRAPSLLLLDISACGFSKGRAVNHLRIM